MTRKYTITIIWVMLCLPILLVACKENETTSPTAAPTGLSLDSIPTLAFIAPTAASQVVPISVDDPRFPIEPDPAGKALYETNCGQCHGINGEGQDQSASTLIVPPAHNNNGHTWHHPDQQNFATVYLGRHIDGAMEMPSFREKLTEDEIFSILAYIKTFWGNDELAMQIETTHAFANQ